MVDSVCMACRPVLDSVKRFAHLGLTKARYYELLEEQRNGCAVCGFRESSKKMQGLIRSLCVDHCHSTGKIRGLLCGKCNRALGLAGDSIERLEAMIAYLKRHGGEKT